MTNATCLVDTCDRPSKTRGMCGMHAERVRSNGDPHIVQYIQGDDVARFWSKIDKRDDGCWKWLGTIIHNGYGHFRAGDRRTVAHRYAYELLVGPIPDGLHLDHLCKVRDCVNPAHLEPVTPEENNLRSDSPTSVNARKDVCDRGHEFDRLILKPNGKTRRRCTTCQRLAMRELRAKRRAERAAVA